MFVDEIDSERPNIVPLAPRSVAVYRCGDVACFQDYPGGPLDPWWEDIVPPLMDPDEFRVLCPQCLKPAWLVEIVREIA
jgi:hypothetical protein